MRPLFAWVTSVSAAEINTNVFVILFQVVNVAMIEAMNFTVEA